MEGSDIIVEFNQQKQEVSLVAIGDDAKENIAKA